MDAQNCLFRALECSYRAHSDLDKLMEALSFIRESEGPRPAAWLRSRRGRHGALTGRRIAGTSFGTLARRRRGRLVGRAGGAGTIPPCCWRRSGWCLRRDRRRLHCLVKLISFADAGLVRMKPRCTLQAHNVAIEEAQHFRKIAVKSVLGEVWFRSDCRRDVRNEVAVDRYFGNSNSGRGSLFVQEIRW